MTDLLEKIISLCKRRGFVYPTSEIYGGLTSSYDYGPLGVELLRNIRDAWWNTFVHLRESMVGLDSQILLHPTTWVASGHVNSFADPMVEDKKTHRRYRADHLIESWLATKDNKDLKGLQVENFTLPDMEAFISKWKIKSPDGNEITAPKNFNLLFETKLGVVEGEKELLYLRGETAQGIFSNFKNIVDSTRVKLPFGVAQIGKSFRNEITTGQFIFRTLELEQAEIEFFFDPQVSDWHELMADWKESMWNFATDTLGIDKDHLRWRKHSDKERSHYSKETFDLDYHFPFGWKELWGVAYRTDYDLTQHIKHSGKSLEYTDPVTQRKFIPHVIEPALGINRAMLMILAESIRGDEKRIYLSLKPKLAPFTVAVFPLVANKPELTTKARKVYVLLKTSGIKVVWDDRGNIGKRYLYQDEAGTPWCVTIDYDTLENDTVTVRDRDTMKQERMSIVKLRDYFHNKLG
ncbi:MAG: glycine--tRNA ligase [Patescibacteria group bacterium]